MMSYMLYLCGLAVTSVSGYLGYEWWFIFIGAAFLSLGHAMARPPNVREVAKEDPLIWLKYPVYSILGHAIVTGPLYGLISPRLSAPEER